MHAFALVLVLGQAPERPPVDLRSLLAEAVDPAACARLPEPAYSLRSISLRTTGQSAGGPSQRMEIDGPGALVRIEARGPIERVRIFLDGAAEALITLPGAPEDPWRAFCESTPEGWILRLPVPFARHGRVECDGASESSCDVTYRAYSAGTDVATVAVGDWKGARARTIEPLGTETFTYSLSEENPDGGLTCLDPKNARGSRAITEIHLRAEATDLGRALRNARIRIAFDGETSVLCPLGEFFAAAPRGGIHESRPLSVLPGVDEATGRPGTQLELVCRFVMPYRERFDLVIDAKEAGDLHVAGSVRTMPWDWDERSMRFHAAWKAPEGPSFRIEGRGVLVGESCSIGAGDEVAPAWSASVRADDGATISYPLPEMGSTRISRRFRELDRVPFQSSLEWAATQRLDREGKFPLASTIWYYALPGPLKAK